MKFPALFLVSFLLLLPRILMGQFVENVSLQKGANDTQYSITYDLVAPYANIPCVIKVKISAIGNAFYLEEVTGDVGNLVYPGKKKEIKWDYVKELVHFSGDINISIEATPCVNVAEKLKKHKPIVVKLAPIYEPKKSYAVKLFRKGKEVVRLNDIMLIENTFSLSLPKKTKKRGKYQLAITDGDTTYFSNSFKVKPRISLAWLAVPAAAVPIYILLNQYQESDEPLPGPPPVPED